MPIANEFHAALTLVVLVGAMTLWMRFVGAITAGWMANRSGRRAPLMISIQRAFAGSIQGIDPIHASERFPTEIRAAAAAFCCHMGAIVGGFVSPLPTYLAVERHMGFAASMLIGTVGGLISFLVTLFFSPKTKGQTLTGRPTRKSFKSLKCLKTGLDDRVWRPSSRLLERSTESYDVVPLDDCHTQAPS